MGSKIVAGVSALMVGSDVVVCVVSVGISGVVEGEVLVGDTS
jgi:hypothetical protein